MIQVVGFDSKFKKNDDSFIKGSKEKCICNIPNHMHNFGREMEIIRKYIREY